MDKTITSVVGDELSVRRIRDRDAFDSLREPWNSLADKQAYPSVFHRHEWFQAALGWRHRDSKLFTIAVFDGNNLVGICPLVLTLRSSGPVTTRVLEFLTVPDTQLCDILVAPDRRNETLFLIAQMVASCRSEWDLIVMSYLSPDSPTHQVFASYLGSQGIRSEVETRHCAVDIDLSGDWNAYYSTRGRRLKKSNNHIRNKLREKGKVSVEWYSPTEISSYDIDDLLNTITHISSRSWKCQTGKSLDNTAPAEFIRILTHHAADNNWLSIWLLSLDDRAVAMEYQLVYKGHVHALRADFDEDMEHLSPGSYLNRVIIERLFDTDNHVYHMGPGANEYKLKWSNSQADLYSLIGYSNSVIARILWLHRHRLRPLLKRVYRFMKSVKPDSTN